MTGPQVLRTNAGTPAPPERELSPVEVRAEGVLLKRVSQGAADQLVSRGWAEWRGSGRRRHLELTDSAPLSSLHGSWGSSGDGTRQIRADGTGARDPGQAFGAPRLGHLEHIPR